MFVGIDVGGSGSRLVATGEGHRKELEGPGVPVSGAGSRVEQVVRDLLDLARRRAEGGVTAVGIGASGLSTLVPDPSGVAERLAAELRVPVALANDAVTAHLGALGGEPGAVISLGTGAIAVGWDGARQWRRVDGWGHLFGDRGGGAWIGMRALAVALEEFDGVRPGADQSAPGSALLEAARRRFGEPLTWPGQFYTREDRAGLLASLAIDVVDLADGDPAARRIVEEAAMHAAWSLDVALLPGVPPRFSAVGGLVSRGGPVLAGLRAGLSSLRPGAELLPAAGEPIDGAVELARRVHRGGISTSAGFVWVA